MDIFALDGRAGMAIPAEMKGPGRYFFVRAARGGLQC
jgi:hypothetical protein